MNKKLTTTAAVFAILAGFSINGKDNGNPAAGKTIYDQKCSSCHEATKQGGNSQLAPSVRNPLFLHLADDALITTIIKKGRAGTLMTPMPGGIKDEEIPHLLAYLRSIPVSDPVKMKLSKIKMDPSRKISGSSSAGEEKYNRYCQQCHGTEGAGVVGNGPGIGRPGFLDIMPDDYIMQTVKYGRPGTPMRGFYKSAGLANLEESDISDIIAYLKSLN